MFQDTLQPVDTRIRAQREYARPSLDMRYSKQIKMTTGPTTIDLVHTARSRSAAATMNFATQQYPVDAATLRKRSNDAVHGHEREQQACVYALRIVERDANQEFYLLQKSAFQLEKTLEDPRRMIWLVDQCQHRRTHRPDNSRDIPSTMFTAEKALAIDMKARLERSLSQTKTVVARFHTARGDLSTTIKSRTASLGLNPETMASTAASGYVLTGNEFPCLSALQAVVGNSQFQRESNATLMDHVTRILTQTRTAIDRAMKEKIEADRSLERELLLAKGEARVASNAAQRGAHTAEIRREVHLGATQGRFKPVAEKSTRPLVLSYERDERHTPGHVTRSETTGEHFLSFTKTLKTATAHVETLGTTRGLVDHALKDRTMTKKVDEHTLRMHRAYSPQHRVK